MYPNEIRADPVTVSLNHLRERTEWECGEKETNLAYFEQKVGTATSR